MINLKWLTMIDSTISLKENCPIAMIRTDRVIQNTNSTCRHLNDIISNFFFFVRSMLMMNYYQWEHSGTTLQRSYSTWADILLQINRSSWSVRYGWSSPTLTYFITTIMYVLANYCLIAIHFFSSYSNLTICASVYCMPHCKKKHIVVKSKTNHLYVFFFFFFIK